MNRCYHLVSFLASATALTLTACVGELVGGDDVNGGSGSHRPGGSGSGNGGDPSDPNNPGGVNQPNAPGGGECVSQLRVRRIWKLTPDQIVHTVQSVLPGATMSVQGLASTIPQNNSTFSNHADRLDLSTPHVNELLGLADDFAEQLVEQRATFASCLEGNSPDSPCVSTFLDGLLMRAFRRPPEAAEVTRYVSFYEEQVAERGSLEALRQVLRAVFLSPHFLYRTELGPDGSDEGSLTQYERASALSYSLADRPPDEPLMAAAEAGELTSSDQVAAHVRRLLETPETARGVLQFLEEYFSIRRVMSVDKDANLYPDFTPDFRRELVGESLAFFEEVLWRDDARFSTLLTADYSMVNDRVAPLYGLEPPGSPTYEKVLLPAGQRSGVLTQAAFLAPLGGFAEPDIINRGHFVREHLLCHKLPPVPENIPEIPATEGLSRRERLETVHTEDPACKFCHQFMDPIGFTFEHYDAIGRFQTTEVVGGVEVPLDSSGAIVESSRGDIPLENALELGQVLADLPEAQECFVQGLAAYLSGASDGSNTCRLQRAAEAFRSTDGEILDAVVALLSDEEFFLRTE